MASLRQPVFPQPYVEGLPRVAGLQGGLEETRKANSVALGPRQRVGTLRLTSCPRSPSPRPQVSGPHSTEQAHVGNQQTLPLHTYMSVHTFLTMKSNSLIFKKVIKTANDKFYHFCMARLSPTPTSLEHKRTFVTS